MFGKSSGGGLVGRPRRSGRPIPSARGSPSPRRERPGLSDELGEDRVDQPFVLGEPSSILRRPGRLSEAAAVVELDGQEVSEQRGTVRVGRPAEEVFDQRAFARARRPRTGRTPRRHRARFGSNRAGHVVHLLYATPISHDQRDVDGLSWKCQATHRHWR